MAEIIAFYGSPGSGKTSISLKAAMETYINTKDTSVIFLSTGTEVPGMGLLFPNYDPEDIVSLSSILDSTTITPDSILKNMITVKSMKNFGCIGLKAGETKYSFPEPTEDKISAFFNSLEELADYIFIDCSDDIISNKAMDIADKKVRIITPDLKGITWLATSKRALSIPEAGIINVINITTKSLYLPIEEVCKNLEKPAYILPYSINLAQQMLDGTMYKPLKDARFRKRFRNLVNQLMSIKLEVSYE